MKRTRSSCVTAFLNPLDIFLDLSAAISSFLAYLLSLFFFARLILRKCNSKPLSDRNSFRLFFLLKMASVQISTFNVQYFSLFYGNSSEYFNRKNVEETDKSFTDSCSHSNSLESEQCDKWLVEMSGDNLKYCLSRTIKMVTYCKIMFEHVKLLKYIGSIRLCVCVSVCRFSMLQNNESCCLVVVDFSRFFLSYCCKQWLSHLNIFGEMEHY